VTQPSHRSTVHRLVELLLVLQVQGRTVSLTELRATIPDYADRDAAAIAAGLSADERDKDFHQLVGADLEHLRAAGLRIDELNENHKPWNDRRNSGTPKLLQARGALTMAPLRLDPDEVLALYLAVRTWGPLTSAVSRTADRSTRVLAEAASAGRTNDEGHATAQASLELSPVSLASIAEAVEASQPVTFNYQSTPAASIERRWVDPWCVVHKWGRNYLVGHDRARADTRVFRASRIVGAICKVPTDEMCQVPNGDAPFTSLPSGADASALVAVLLPVRTAVVRVAPRETDRFSHELRDDARRLNDLADRQDSEGVARFEVTYRDAEWIAGILRQYGRDLVVEQPDDVRQLVEDGLAAVADQIAALTRGAR